MRLKDKLLSLDQPKIGTGYSETIEDFWESFIKPLLPDKSVCIRWFKLLLKYCDDEEAVFAIRNYSTPIGGKKNYESLRRGFFTVTNAGFNFFYTDNYFAAYFLKMALDKYVPDYDDFKKLMVTKEFPARFGPYDSKFEKPKAAYSIDGSKGKNPGFTKAGYKISHVIDSGKNYDVSGNIINIEDWCRLYFPRGEYADWFFNHEHNCFIRNLSVTKESRKILKAHFLRLACPMNYILTPKAGQNRCHALGVNIKGNDIGECDELQAFAKRELIEHYGDDYKYYLSQLMLPDIPSADDSGKTIVKCRYGANICVSEKSIKAKPTTVTQSSGSGIGQYAKQTFTDLLISGKLSHNQITNLMDEDYCRREFRISYPIIVDVDVNSYKKERYYRNHYVLGKYAICKEWYAKHWPLLNNWLLSNGYI